MKLVDRGLGKLAALVAAALFFVALAAPSPALAFEPGQEHATKVQPRKVEEARAHFASGMKQFDEGHFPAARDEMEKAYALAPSYKLLYNIGLVYRQLNDPARAIQTFEAYLSQGAWEIPDARVTEVTRVISELTPLVGSVRITTSIRGVQISIDDRFVGQTPMEDPIVVNPGQHKISGKLLGYLPESKTVSAATGEVVPVQLDLKEAPVPINYTYLGVLLLLTVLAGGVVVFFLRKGRSKDAADGAAP